MKTTALFFLAAGLAVAASPSMTDVALLGYSQTNANAFTESNQFQLSVNVGYGDGDTIGLGSGLYRIKGTGLLNSNLSCGSVVVTDEEATNIVHTHQSPVTIQALNCRPDGTELDFVLTGLGTVTAFNVAVETDGGTSTAAPGIWYGSTGGEWYTGAVIAFDLATPDANDFSFAGNSSTNGINVYANPTGQTFERAYGNAAGGDYGDNGYVPLFNSTATSSTDLTFVGLNIPCAAVTGATFGSTTGITVTCAANPSYPSGTANNFTLTVPNTLYSATDGIYALTTVSLTASPSTFSTGAVLEIPLQTMTFPF